MPEGEIPQENAHYVLDGGALLHKIPWDENTSVTSILNKYVQYTLRRYGKATVVFDGYSPEPSTKEVAHRRRKGGVTGPRVEFQDPSHIMMTKKTSIY